MVQTLSPLIIGLTVGLGLGMAVAWIVMRKSTELAAGQVRSETQIEVVRLNEKLGASIEENRQVLRRLEAAEIRSTELQEQVEKLGDERARHEERALRVPGLESQLSQLSAELQKQSARAAGLEEQVVRLPVIEENLRVAIKDNEEVKAQLSNLREKVGGAESTVKAQEDTINRLDADLARISH